jgi:hypothetical protein
MEDAQLLALGTQMQALFENTRAGYFADPRELAGSALLSCSPSRHSRRSEPRKRSQMAFMFGARILSPPQSLFAEAMDRISAAVSGARRDAAREQEHGFEHGRAKVAPRPRDFSLIREVAKTGRALRPDAGARRPVAWTKRRASRRRTSSLEP